MCIVPDVKLNFGICRPRFWWSDLFSCPLMYSYEIWITGSFRCKTELWIIRWPWFWWSDLLSCPLRKAMNLDHVHNWTLHIMEIIHTTTELACISGWNTHRKSKISITFKICASKLRTTKWKYACMSKFKRERIEV
jgi:hypothetical protein